MVAKRWVASLDAFRTLPRDLSEASPTGAAMTLVAVVTCLVLFVCETSAFLHAEPRTDMSLDSSQDAQLRINFDVQFYDMPCDFLTVGMWDAFGTERMNITRNIFKQSMDHEGKEKGHGYTDDELVELEYSDQSYTADELQDLDSDWSSSSDQFQHDDFEMVVQAHDYTFVNFYADWCPHSRHFVPTWDKFETSVNSGQDAMVDADSATANVRALRINCVDFEKTCQDQKIHSFPSVRLYRRSTTDAQFSVYDGPRTTTALSAFAHEEVRKKHTHTGAHYHEMFTEGCRMNGHVDAPRIPGTLHFEAMHKKDRNLNSAFTNLSHQVHHFSFGDEQSTLSSLPPEYSQQAAPLDGKVFTVEKFHMAPQHFIKVVHTRFESDALRSYQLTHQWSVRTLQRKAIPQAKFSYDLSPVEVVIRAGDVRWYDFVTSVFAIIGGAFTFMSMTTGILNLVSAQLKLNLNKFV